MTRILLIFILIVSLSGICFAAENYEERQFKGMRNIVDILKKENTSLRIEILDLMLKTLELERKTKEKKKWKRKDEEKRRRYYLS